MSVSRRETLAWVSAALAGPYISLGLAEPAEAQTATGLWKELTFPPITAPGYGTDPNLLKPVTPWLLTLTPEQREESHWSIAIRMLGNALKHATYLRAATISLQTALAVEALLASPLAVGGG